MKITKRQLQRIIKEEVRGALSEEANFNPATGEPLTDAGWKMAAKNPRSDFHKQAIEKVGDRRPVISSEEAKKKKENMLRAVRGLMAGWGKIKDGFGSVANDAREIQKALKSMPKGTPGRDEINQKLEEMMDLILQNHLTAKSVMTQS
jgi:hypothetical protein